MSVEDISEKVRLEDFGFHKSSGVLGFSLSNASNFENRKTFEKYKIPKLQHLRNEIHKT